MSVRLQVRLAPRAGRDAIEGVDPEGRLRVRVAAPPVGGAANEALVRLLVASLDVPRGSLAIVSGETSRHKLVSVQLPRSTIEARWPGIRVTLTRQ